MTEGRTSVRLSSQSRSLLLLAEESRGVTVRMKLFRDFNLQAAGWWWNSWCPASVVCVPCDRQQPSWCEEGRFRPVGVHSPSSLVWGSPRWFGSSRVESGSACARVEISSTQDRLIQQLSSIGRDSWGWVSMPCTPTFSSRVHGWFYLSRLPTYLSSRCAFYQNQIKSNQVLFSHTYNLQYVHFIKSDVMWCDWGDPLETPWGL